MFDATENKTTTSNSKPIKYTFFKYKYILVDKRNIYAPSAFIYEFAATKKKEQNNPMKEKEKRKNPSYRQKVRLIQESNGQCPFCDFSDSGRLQFHHIDENPANTVLVNLIAVCPNCHSSIGEGIITEKEVIEKKKELEKKLKQMKKTQKSTKIKISESTLNNPVLGDNNKVTINVKKQVTKKVVEKYPEGSIGRDVLMYGYSKYLADRYAEYKTAELKRSGQKFNYAAFYGKVKKDFKSGGFFQIPQTRFPELVEYMQKRIDRTMIAKMNKGKGVLRNYSSFEEYKEENK